MFYCALFLHNKPPFLIQASQLAPHHLHTSYFLSTHLQSWFSFLGLHQSYRKLTLLNVHRSGERSLHMCVSSPAKNSTWILLQVPPRDHPSKANTNVGYTRRDVHICGSSWLHCEAGVAASGVSLELTASLMHTALRHPEDSPKKELEQVRVSTMGP